jgi:hypothetical protein
MKVLITYVLPNNTIKKREILARHKDEFLHQLKLNGCRAILYKELDEKENKKG